MKFFISHISVFAPGNFITVSIDSLGHKRNYKVLNADQFIDKFYNVYQNDGFSVPRLELRLDWMYKLDDILFIIHKPSRKEEYIIDLHKAKKEKKIYLDITLEVFEETI